MGDYLQSSASLVFSTNNWKLLNKRQNLLLFFLPVHVNDRGPKHRYYLARK